MSKTPETVKIMIILILIMVGSCIVTDQNEITALSTTALLWLTHQVRHCVYRLLQCTNSAITVCISIILLYCFLMVRNRNCSYCDYTLETHALGHVCVHMHILYTLFTLLTDASSMEVTFRSDGSDFGRGVFGMVYEVPIANCGQRRRRSVKFDDNGKVVLPYYCAPHIRHKRWYYYRPPPCVSDASAQHDTDST